MNKFIVWIIIILIVLFGIFFGVKVYEKFGYKKNKDLYDNQNEIEYNENTLVKSIEVSGEDKERTTPSTLVILRTYYTKCKHYVQEYYDIDKSLVNCTKQEFEEKNKGWDVEEFSSKEILLTKEEEKFCNQHYKLKLKDDVIVIYNVSENGIEKEYEQTNITTQYLTDEDILKLKTGIIVYGKENLTNAMEDYE